MSYELKIKAKSLGAEARIIRQEEVKLRDRARKLRAAQKHEQAKKLDRARHSLYEHRTWDVRRETRATNLARAFIKGMPYRKVEPKTNPNSYEMGYMTGRIEKLVKKYAKLPGDVDTREAITAWLEA